MKLSDISIILSFTSYEHEMTKATETTTVKHNVETDTIPVDMSASNVAHICFSEISDTATTTTLTTPADTADYKFTKVAIFESPVNTTLATKPVVLNSSNPQT